MKGQKVWNMAPGNNDSNRGMELGSSHSEPTHSCALDRPFPSEGNKGQRKALLTWDCRGGICSNIERHRQDADGMQLGFRVRAAWEWLMGKLYEH